MIVSPYSPRQRTAFHSLPRSLMLAALGGALLVSAVAPAAADEVGLTQEGAWRVYVDEERGYSVEVPKGWDVQPPAVPEGMVGGRLILSDTPSGQTERVTPARKVEVGVLLVEWDASRSLEAFAEAYNRSYSLIPEEQVTLRESLAMRKAGQEYLMRESTSPLGPVAYTFIPRGSVVWFVWANGPIDDHHREVYERVIDSITFDAQKAPANLKAIFGDGFEPMPLDIRELELQLKSMPETEEDIADKAIVGSTEKAVSASWRVPVFGQYEGGCASGRHRDAANHAVDIPTTTWTQFYTSMPGNEYFVASAEEMNGYGHYLKTSDHSGMTGDCALYAHLGYSLGNFGSRNRTSVIGYTGQSGGVEPHLHYHAMAPHAGRNCSASQTQATGLSLSNMSGMHTNGNYPDSGVCARVRIPSGWFAAYNNGVYRYLEWQQSNGNARARGWSGNDFQRWKFRWDSGSDTYEIISRVNNYCLASNYPTPAGSYSNVFMWGCDGQPNQQWRAWTYANGKLQFQNEAKGFGSCLDVYSENVYYYGCYTPGPQNQLWRLVPRS